MQLTSSTLVLFLVGALSMSSTALAVPTYPSSHNSNNNGASVHTGDVEVANVGHGDGNGVDNIASSNLNNAVVGVGGKTGGLGSYNARRVVDDGGNVLEARTRKNTQPQYINSPQAANEGSCSVGTAQCCQSLHQTQDLQSQGFFGQLLGASIPLDNLMVGVQCTPVADLVPVAGGSSSCRSQPVCCTGNKYDGLVSVGCSPVGLH